MRRLALVLAEAALLAAVTGVWAQSSLTPLAGFGGADGWLAPGEGGYAYLTTTNGERGIACGNGHLYLVNRGGGNNIRRLDPLTGADLGSPLNVDGISGGTFQVDMVRVAGDGAIYVCNLASPVSAANPFRVYRWANEAATPTVAFSSTNITGGRLGDSFDVTGSGSSTLLLAGESTQGGSGARNGYVVMSTTDGVNYTGSLVTFAGTPPNGGDFRLGITFGDANRVFGTQGGSAGFARYTAYSCAGGSLLGTGALISGTERPMDYAVINGVAVLATVSAANATVRVYDVSEPLSPVLLLQANNTSGTLPANPNANGSVAWGPISGPNATLYALSCNQGIQAFNVMIANTNPVISGSVTWTNGVPLAGVRLATSSGRCACTGTDGSYALAVPPGWSGTVSLEQAGWAATPPIRTHTSVANDMAHEDFSLSLAGACILNATLAGNLVYLGWPSAPGLHYQLQSSTGLVPANWLDLGAAFSGTGCPLATTVPVNPASAGFFRLRLAP